MQLLKKNSSPVIPGNEMVIAGESHTGLVRRNNEDHFLMVNYLRESAHLTLVADGIGGHEHGELASMIVCRTFLNNWKQYKAGEMVALEEMELFIRESIRQSNSEIYTANTRKEMHKPMGSTVVAAIFTATHTIVGHVGDSRLYEFISDKLLCRTVDHDGTETGSCRACRNAISRAIGPCRTVEPTVNIFSRKEESRYLLCSDGLTLHLNDSDIERHFRMIPDARALVGRLMRDSLLAGGRDNISAIVAQKK